MAVSKKIENDPDFMKIWDRANTAIINFAESMGVDVKDLERVSSDDEIGKIVVRMTTIGVKAVRRERLVSPHQIPK